MLVWLNGERFDVAYLLDISTGKVQRYVQPRIDVGPCGGLGQMTTTRRFIGWYVSPADGGLYLQVGRKQWLLSDVHVVRLKRSRGGFWSHLKLSNRADRSKSVKLRKLTLARAIFSVIDPTYDNLDESENDFLAEVADFIGSEERHQLALENINPLADPWHLIDEVPPQDL